MSGTYVWHTNSGKVWLTYFNLTKQKCIQNPEPGIKHTHSEPPTRYEKLKKYIYGTALSFIENLCFVCIYAYCFNKSLFTIPVFIFKDVG